jgi:hypothetical protein
MHEVRNQQLDAVRWGRFSTGKFHLTADRGDSTLCGAESPGLGPSVLAAEYVEWAKGEGMICKRCLNHV